MNENQLNCAIQELLDGSISDNDLDALQNELETSERARELYLDSAEIHSFLAQAEQPTTQQTNNIVPMERIVRRQKRKTFRVAAIAAAALLLIGLITMRLFFVPEKQPTLVFKTSPDTQYSLTHSSTKDSPGDLILENGSRLILSQGTVELTFKSGVKSIVMAPADLTLHREDTLYLNKGRAWFQVPQKAIGFNVKTKELDIVDLGTEFGVFAHLDEHDEVHVFKGKVQVTALRLRKASAIITAGQARQIDPIGRLTTIPVKGSQFLTNLPKSLPHLHWSFDGNRPFHPEGSLPETHTITTRAIQSDSRPATQRLVTGKYGNALSFNGQGDHLITDWTGILGKTPRSVSCWIKIHPNNPKGWASIAEWGELRGENYWRFRVVEDQGKAILRLGLGNYWYDGSSDLADGNWHHITCIDNGQIWKTGTPTIKFYIDGHEESALRQQATLIEHRNTQEGFPLIIGANHTIPNSNSKFFLRGEIDELFIFQGVLSESSIHSLMLNHYPHNKN